MAEAWFRTPWIERAGSSTPLSEATTAATAGAVCLARSSAMKARVRPCCGPLVAGSVSLRSDWAVLAGFGSLPQPAGVMRSTLQPAMQAGRSDLRFRHQHGSAGHSACFVIHFKQLCRIGQVCRKLARDAGLAALATALRLAHHSHCIAAAGAGPWFAGVPLSKRKTVAQTAVFHV